MQGTVFYLLQCLHVAYVVSFITMMRRFERIYRTLDGVMKSHFPCLIFPTTEKKGMFKKLRHNFIYFLLHLTTLSLFQAIWQRCFFNPEDGNSIRLRKVDVNLQNPTNNLFVALQTDSPFENLPLVNVQ